MQSSKHRNPWGEMSYAELIQKALQTAPNGRLLVNEIYDWFIENIPYFKARSGKEISAGWKNSIRHNLSLHDRFKRLEEKKHSAWILDPECLTVKLRRKDAIGYKKKQKRTERREIINEAKFKELKTVDQSKFVVNSMNQEGSFEKEIINDYGTGTLTIREVIEGIILRLNDID